MNHTYQHQFIEHAVSTGGLEFHPKGRKLKSERYSPYFFNSGKYSTGSALTALALGYAQAIIANWDKLRPEVIFGPAYKGITLASAVAVELSRLGYDLPFAFNRKEAKEHAEGGVLVGSVDGLRTLIIDDVITDGATKVEAMEIVKEHGGIPIGLVIAFDRHERGVATSQSAAQAFIERFGLPVVSIVSLTDMVEYLGRMDVILPNNLDRMQMSRLVIEYGATYAPEDL